MNTPGTMTKIGAASQILHGIGAPVNQKTVGAMVGWMNAEGGNWGNSAAYNPLNTTLNAPGARSINSVGVKAYGNWGQGISATVQTLKQPNMSGIVNAFRAGDPQAVIHAIGSSPWGTDGNLVAKTISDALGQKYTLPSAGIATQMAKASTPGLSTPGVTNTGPQTDWNTAITDALLQNDANAGPSNGSNLMNAILNNAGLDTTTPTTTITAPAANPSASSAGQSVRAGNFATGKGDVNPLGAGWTLGRTDMGVDANAKPGTPIRALNDSVVKQIVPNWYNGQPLVLMQITSGPNTGKYWYAAEQITNLPKVGQVLPKGSVVATYAPSGTGIEIGWGSPTSSQRTLAGATTGYTEGQQTAAGLNFRQTELR